LSQVEFIRSNNKERLLKVKMELRLLMIDLKNMKQVLLAHYHKLLKDGRDTRIEGIIWIIKEILLLGSNVILSHLPNFLDEKCIMYLFNVTLIQ
jgi:hypothetical protein